MSMSQPNNDIQTSGNTIAIGVRPPGNTITLAARPTTIPGPGAGRPPPRAAANAVGVPCLGRGLAGVASDRFPGPASLVGGLQRIDLKIFLQRQRSNVGT